MKNSWIAYILSKFYSIFFWTKIKHSDWNKTDETNKSMNEFIEDSKVHQGYH